MPRRHKILEIVVQLRKSGYTPTTTADANVAAIVQQAGIFTGFGGTARPGLQTDGNFNAVAGDVYRLDSLFQASSPGGQAIAGYRVALDGGNGTLNLNGVPTTLTTFTTAQFAQLTYTAGDQGTQGSLVVIAQTGTLQANGSLTGEIDSPAVQITGDVTGNRSINAMNALVNTPTTTADANVAGIVQQAGIFTGFGGTARPGLQTDGNFTAAAGDVYRLELAVSGQRAKRSADRRLSRGAG